MTRDEAIQKVAALLWGRRGTITVQSSLDAEHRATEAVDIAVALGLKLDDVSEQETLDSLSGVFQSQTMRQFTVDALKRRGFKIVRSD